MSIHSFKMPDLGEGTVAAEIVAWHVKAGDQVVEGQTIAEVSTDKAVVEIPAPVTGRVHALAGEPGSSISVGAELISFDTSGAPKAQGPAVAPVVGASPKSADVPVPTEARVPEKAPSPSRASPTAAAAARVMTSPATRRRAREAGVDLKAVQGSGPGGRIKREDLDAVLAPAAWPRPPTPRPSRKSASSACAA